MILNNLFKGNFEDISGWHIQSVQQKSHPPNLAILITMSNTNNSRETTQLTQAVPPRHDDVLVGEELEKTNGISVAMCCKPIPIRKLPFSGGKFVSCSPSWPTCVMMDVPSIYDSVSVPRLYLVFMCTKLLSSIKKANYKHLQKYTLHFTRWTCQV